MSEELQLDKSKWKPVTFGDVVAEVRTTTKDPVADGIERVVGLEHIEPECIHLRNWASIEEETTFTKVFRKGHVLFGRRRAYLKKAAVADFDGICSGDITVMKAKSGLLPELLPFLVNNDKFFDYAVQHSAGGLSPRTKFKDIANYEFLLPPKDQQAKLAELLWAADENVNKALRIVQNIDILIKSQRTAEFKARRLNKRIDDVAYVRAGIGFPLEYQEGRIGDTPFIKVADMNSDLSLRVIAESQNHVTSETLQHLKGKLFPADTIIFPKVGAAIATEKKRLLGTPAMVDNNIMGVYLKDESNLLPGYLFEYFNNISISALSNAGTVPSINAATVKDVRVPVPSEAVQRDYLNKLQVSLKAFDNGKAMAEASKTAAKSLINQIF